MGRPTQAQGVALISGSTVWILRQSQMGSCMQPQALLELSTLTGFMGLGAATAPQGGVAQVVVVTTVCCWQLGWVQGVEAAGFNAKTVVPG